MLKKTYFIPKIDDSQAPVLLQVDWHENHVEGEDVHILVPPLDGALVAAHDQVEEEVCGHAVDPGKSTPAELGLLASSGGHHL